MIIGVATITEEVKITGEATITEEVMITGEATITEEVMITGEDMITEEDMIKATVQVAAPVADIKALGVLTKDITKVAAVATTKVIKAKATSKVKATNRAKAKATSREGVIKTSTMTATAEEGGAIGGVDVDPPFIGALRRIGSVFLVLASTRLVPSYIFFSPSKGCLHSSFSSSSSLKNRFFLFTGQ